MADTSFDRFLIALDEAIRWAEDLLGRRIRPGRFGEYRRFYEQLLNSFPSDDSPVLLDEQWAQKTLDGLIAGQELVMIQRNLSAVPEPQLVPRLRRFVAGALLESGENPATRTSQARDVGFELVLAARLAAGGVEPILPDRGDIAAEVAGLPLHFECKRPQSVAGLEEAVAKAADQLAARDSTIDPSPRGVIGISIGKIVHQGTSLVVAETVNRARDVLFSEAARFVQANERLWQRRDWPFVHVVIVDISAPVHVTGSNSWLWGQWGVLNPNWNTDLDEPWIRRLQDALNAVGGVSGF